MPRKMTMRENVAAVRMRLTQLSNLSREHIEMALMHYDSNVDRTVEAFEKNGAIEALHGWVDVKYNRDNTLAKKNSAINSNNGTAPNALVRPSQRVTNIFQKFAETSQPNSPSNDSKTFMTTSSTSSIIEQSISSTSTSIEQDESLELQNDNVKSTSLQRGVNQKHRNKSSSSGKDVRPVTITDNKKLLTKSAKDLQRQSSTLTNVELTFNEEIKSSTKRISEVFKQIHEILKAREVELYLELDQVKEQGLKMIQHRQNRTVEFRQRMDRCDRLSSSEIDVLRNEIKQFVSERRYDLGEQLGSIHRFEFDTKTIDSLKNFGRIIGISRSQTLSTSSVALESQFESVNHTVENHEKPNEIVESSPLPQRNDSITSKNMSIHPMKTETVSVLVAPTQSPRRIYSNGTAKRNFQAQNYDHSNVYNRNEPQKFPRPLRRRPTGLTPQTTVPVQS